LVTEPGEERVRADDLDDGDVVVGTRVGDRTAAEHRTVRELDPYRDLPGDPLDDAAGHPGTDAGPSVGPVQARG